MKANVENIYPLTPMQEGMLFHALKEPRSTAYFEQLSWHVRGVIDVPLLERCWNALIRHHAVLRTAYAHQNTDRPLQIVLRERPLTIDVHDLRGTDPAAAVKAFKAAERARGFALESEPLLRVAVLTLGDDEHEIVWSHHHIILDGWSVGLLLAELLELYRTGLRGEHYALEAVTPFSKYVKWLEARDRDASMVFWRNALQELTDPVTLPHTRADAPTGARGTAVFDLGVSATSALHALASRLGVTVPVVLHAAWALLLARYKDSADVVFGSVVSGRTPEVAGIERMVGNFINTIPVRVRIEHGQTFADLVARIHADAARAEPHHAVPLSRIQSLHHSGDALFGTLMSFANYPVDPRLNNGAGVEEVGFIVDRVSHAEQTHYDIDVQFIPSADLHARITYAKHLYEHSQIEAIGGHLRTILAEVSRDENLPVDTADLLGNVWSAAAAAAAFVCNQSETLVTAFDRQAAATPDACAVEAPNGRLTYRELNARANALAQRLHVSPDDRVALQLERGIELAVGILGVLKAGACYVPLEPALPLDRIELIVRDAACRTVITNIADESCYSNPRVVATPSNLAYVIYTSGSTGLPKGVMIEHAAVLNLVQGLREHVYDRHPSPLRVALIASYSFDASVQQIFAALLHGHTLVIVDDNVKRDAAALNRFLVDADIDIVDGTPTLFQTLAHASGFEAMRRRVRHALIGGEPLPWALARRIARPDGMLVSNVYGPTECCVDATAHLIDDEETPVGATVPIGRPLPNVRAVVLDSAGRVAPIGARGELWIGGAGVARGYLNQTSEKFANGMYRTADAARWLPNGTLEYLGRLDDQVKVRGYRIELGEIEHHLTQHSAITHAAVIVQNGELHASIVLAAPVSVDKLRDHLARALPDHMIPARFFRRDELPRTSSGKLDRATLAAQGLGVALDVASTYVAPATPIEQRLAEIWQSVLAIPRIGVDDNYFSLGGDSIKAIQILSRMLRQNLRMELADLFRHRTIRGLAPHVIEVATRTPTASTSGGAPLSAAQARFFAEHTVEPERFHHAVVLESDQRLDIPALEAALTVIADHHDALRLTFRDGLQHVMPRGPIVRVVTANTPAELLGGFDLAAGPLWRAGIVGKRLVLVVHHLCIDAVSWSILLEDLAAAYAGRTLPPPTDAFTTWTTRMAKLDVRDQTAYWTLVGTPASRRLSRRRLGAVPWEPERDAPCSAGQDAGAPSRYRDQDRVTASLSTAETHTLLTEANRAYNTTAEDLLLATLGRAMHTVFDITNVAVLLEHHGRSHAEGLDLSRTIGWFTTLYPIVLTTEPTRDIGFQIKATKEALRAVPQDGIGYGLLRYVHKAFPESPPRPSISFNYLGTLGTPTHSTFRFVNEPLDGHVSPDAETLAELEVSGMVIDGALQLTLAYDRQRFLSPTMDTLLAAWQRELRIAIEHCRQRPVELTPADLSYAGLSVDELEDIFQ
jgi:amino acid adenylation domain-containing protein/non-ribosomal peptide synthase protein (TIGR01720 family)